MELVEYLVLTQCGRRFGWSAPGLDTLFRDMRDRDYTVTYVKPMTEYEAEVTAREEQEELNYELDKAAGELKPTA